MVRKPTLWFKWFLCTSLAALKHMWPELSWKHYNFCSGHCPSLDNSHVEHWRRAVTKIIEQKYGLWSMQVMIPMIWQQSCRTMKKSCQNHGRAEIWSSCQDYDSNDVKPSQFVIKIDLENMLILAPSLALHQWCRVMKNSCHSHQTKLWFAKKT